RAGKVRGAARAGDDHAHALGFEGLDPLAQRLGGAMRREHARFASDPEAFESLGGESHRGLIRRRAHDDRDARAQATATSCRALSERQNLPSKLTRSAPAYARSRACATVSPLATMCMTRPPLTTTSPVAFRLVAP